MLPFLVKLSGGWVPLLHHDVGHIYPTFQGVTYVINTGKELLCELGKVFLSTKSGSDTRKHVEGGFNEPNLLMYRIPRIFRGRWKGMDDVFVKVSDDYHAVPPFIFIRQLDRKWFTIVGPAG